MRYDSERQVILVSVGEAVEIARRGISKTLPFDEEAPGGLLPSRAAKEKLGQGGVPIRYSFFTDEYAFELVGECDGISEDAITYIASIRSNPEKPKKEELAYARGVGFILSYMLAVIEGHESVTLSTVFINENDGETATRVEKIAFSELGKFFTKCINEVTKYARPEIERVTVRMPSMKNLRFPYDKVREGQGDMVRAAYRALARGTNLYASLPTGTGKTVSALYPAVRLIGEGRQEKVFYLTPKTTTADVARECLTKFADEGAIIRGIILASKERSCTEGMICRSSRSCPLASENRLKDATLKLYDLGITVVTIADILPVSKEFSVCPYELELAYSELCDVIICDINYLFDPRVYIRRFFEEGGRYSFLIDEAHNLAERAREMYSAEMTVGNIRRFARSAVFRESDEAAATLPMLADALEEELMESLRDEIREDKDGNRIGATHLSEIPSSFYPIIKEICEVLERALKSSYRILDDVSEERTRAIKDVYYSTLRVYDTMLAFDDSYKLFIFLEGGEVRMKLFNVDPGNRIRDRLSKGRGSVFFSATLSPISYYKAVLGGDGTSDVLEAHSPFAPECLSVSIMDKISTRYSERERTVPAVARVIAATLSARRGNYMVFLPSFEYLEVVAKAFRYAYPKIRTLTERRGMTMREKAEFIEAFTEKSDGYLVGFCVLGGVYSEGIDLVGESLIGAVVVGIGMPTLSYEREAMAEYYDEKYEAGKQYAYIYPGMNRVLQAAGRVIRTENDRGVIVLIDDRFDDPIYKKTIPSLWKGMEYVADAKELNARIREFWQEVDEEE